MKIMNKENHDLLSIDFDITMACQNRCDYCFTLKNLDNTKKFNRPVFDKLKNELKKFNNVHLNIVGGEPFLCDLRVLDEIEARITVYSNLNFAENQFKKKYINPDWEIIATWHDSNNDEFFKSCALIAKPIVSIIINDVDKSFNKVQWLKENNLKYSIDFLVIDDKDTFTDLDNPKYKEMINGSINKDVVCTIDDESYNWEDVQRLDLKNISSYYYTSCRLSNFAISYDGSIKPVCKYPFSSHLDDGIEINDVFCRNYWCVCDVQRYKKLIRPK